MSYLVLARKFRPQQFSEISGQNHVTRTLINSIRREKVAHAYLFSGPRGVGKTSIARIFAKALNCKEPFGAPSRQAGANQTSEGSVSPGFGIEPCGCCANCLEIAQSSNLAVREIDGASHNSVDNVRDLIESFRALPPPGSRYKVYIIDEVHMFSTAAFNALLKSLEEPPPHTIFILATTEAHKIPETVISRCQRHDFRSLGLDDIEQCLQSIAREEAMQIEPEAIQMVARLSDGSMRDAQSLLERVNAFCDGAISAANASMVLGTVERAILARLSQAILSRQVGDALELVAEIFAKGVDPARFARDFAAHFRELLIARFGAEKGLARAGIGEADRVELLRQARSISEQDVQDLAQIARQGCDAAVRSSYPKYAIEALVVRMATREPAMVLAEVLAALQSSGPSGFGRNAVRSEQGSDRSVETAPERKRASQPTSAPSIISVPAQGVASTAPAPAVRSVAGEQGVAVGNRAAAPTVAPSNAPVTARALDWPSFVDHAAGALSRILVEHLRRLVVDRFELIESTGEGVLSARGAAFSIDSLNHVESKRKLQEALVSFVGNKVWLLALKVDAASDVRTTPSGPPGPTGLSLVEQERAERRKSKAERTNDISNHPKIKDLQKIFPGTEIEAITLNEE
jgi:DNA polymerase-3 subunit gamma/tau